MSDYSPSLRIELITTGDQAGVWGGTTNNNLGTLIESAIAGYTSVSVISANQALTALNGAADQSRNQTIALTTTTTAAFNVYAPPAEKTYVIYNASAYAATIYNSDVIGSTTPAPGGTSVTVPAGKTMTIWSDGTNFALQNTHIIGTVVGNVTGDVTGVVAAAAGSTAVTASPGDNDTSIATTAFVQAALQALHPVGSVYINATNATNPGTLLGFGTWTAFGAGRVPVGFDASNPLFDAPEKTGGSADAVVVNHTHTITDPGHAHTYDKAILSSAVIPGGSPNYNPVSITGANTGTASTGIIINNTGVSGESANIQPYITVYMWKRTA